jgi:hypothetical protein
MSCSSNLALAYTRLLAKDYQPVILGDVREKTLILRGVFGKVNLRNHRAKVGQGMTG